MAKIRGCQRYLVIKTRGWMVGCSVIHEFEPVHVRIDTVHLHPPFLCQRFPVDDPRKEEGYVPPLPRNFMSFDELNLFPPFAATD